MVSARRRTATASFSPNTYTRRLHLPPPHSPPIDVIAHAPFCCALLAYRQTKNMLLLIAPLIGAALSGICNDKRTDCANWARDGECSGENAVRAFTLFSAATE